MHSNGLLVGGGYDDLRSRMAQVRRCGDAEKFWSFAVKLPNGPPYLRPLFVKCERAVAKIFRQQSIIGCTFIIPNL
jgi:hypothetical protein